MRKYALNFVLAAFLMTWTACTTPPEYPEEPVITFMEYARDTVRQSLDSNVIKFSFTDGDGDLGARSTDTLPNIFLTDITRGDVYTYRLPFIPEQGIGNGISGEVEITLFPSDQCCDSTRLPCIPEVGAGNEMNVYELQVQDRSGKMSAPILLPPVTLICDY